MIEKKGNKFYLGDRKLGYLYGDRFITHRRPEHYYKKGQGFCINEELVRDYLAPKGYTVIVIYQRKGDKGELAFISEASKLLNFPRVHEEGWDKQILIKKTKFRGD